MQTGLLKRSYGLETSQRCCFKTEALQGKQMWSAPCHVLSSRVMGRYSTPRVVQAPFQLHPSLAPAFVHKTPTKRNAELQAAPGMIEARSHSKWPTRKSSCATPDLRWCRQLGLECVTRTHPPKPMAPHSAPPIGDWPGGHDLWAGTLEAAADVLIRTPSGQLPGASLKPPAPVLAFRPALLGNS